jgi:DNA-binding transcriptional LysR family regulator
MMLSLRELDVFRRVMALGTVTAVAEELHISQPAVSRTLQAAEEKLGFALFLRRRKRLIATAEAQALLAETASAFAALDMVRQRAVDIRTGRAGVLRIAAIAAFANSVLPVAIARYRATRPNVAISLQATNALQVAHLVANHQADIGFIIDSMSVPGISISDLCVTEFGCVMPATHRLARKRTVKPADLVDESLICLSRTLPLGVLAMRVFSDHDVPLHTAIEVTQSTVACALVRAGAGVALLDGLGVLEATAGLVMRPFGPPVEVVGRLVVPRHQPQSRLAQGFVEVLRETLPARTRRGGRLGS